MKELKKEDEELTKKEKVSPWSTILFVGRYSWSYSELGLRMCLTKRIMTDYVESAMIFYAQSTFVPTLLVYPGFS